MSTFDVDLFLLSVMKFYVIGYKVFLGLQNSIGTYYVEWNWTFYNEAYSMYEEMSLICTDLLFLQ